MKIEVEPNKSMSESLKKTALITLTRLNEIDIYPSNTLIDFYDIIH